MLVIKVRSGSSRNLPNSQMMKKRTKFLCSKSNWDFPGGPVAKTSPSNAGGAGSIPGQGAKIPHASWPKKPKHKTEAIFKQIQ